MQNTGFVNSLVTKKKLTPEGREWLLTALDPFHDNAVIPSGYPDSNGGMSVCQLYTQTLEINKPAAAAANWDCCIVNLPYSKGPSARTGCVVDVNPGYLHYESTPLLDLPQGPIEIRAADAGQPLFANSAVAGFNPTNFQGSVLGTIPSAYSGHAHRIVALGMEVHNTTAAISVQGTVTVAEMPQTCECTESWFIDDDAAATTVNIGTYEFNLPPPILANAIVYPGAKQWEAAKGAYVVPTLSSVENPVHSINQRVTVAYRTDDRIGNYGEIAQPDITTVTTPFGKVTNPIPFNSMFMFFSGLSNATTLVLTVKSYVELFPNHNSALLSMASPSPTYDVSALRLYAKVIKDMPRGVPVDMNSKGDWFKLILSLIKNAAPAIGLMADLFVPGLGLPVKTGVASSAALAQSIADRMIFKNTADNSLSRKSKKKRNKKQKQNVTKQLSKIAF